jgi:hypothetical protein
MLPLRAQVTKVITESRAKVNMIETPAKTIGSTNSLKRRGEPKFHAGFGRIFERSKFHSASTPVASQ